MASNKVCTERVFKFSHLLKGTKWKIKYYAGRRTYSQSDPSIPGPMHEAAEDELREKEVIRENSSKVLGNSL